MTSQEMRNQIDNLWTEFWTGGITNPFTVIEQITYLMFSRLLDIREKQNEKKAKTTGEKYNPIFKKDEQHLRWDNFRHESDTDKLLELVRDEVFPHFKRSIKNGSTFYEYMKDAQLMIVKPGLLVKAINTINNLPLTQGDVKGDLYEYLLSKLQQSGIAGQFRTPRHIIELMVKMIDPKPDHKICDPACGTAGFLVGAMEYLNERFTSPGMEKKNEDGSVFYPGDQLFEYKEHIQNELLTGFDFDATMLRIGAMNLLLHGIDNPHIHNQDTLSDTFVERYQNEAEDAYDIIFANPPFKGSLDYENVESSLLGKVKTKKTELLFITLFLRMLKTGGRAAVIVPDGVLFGASKAHVSLRKTLIEENQLEAVISLPSGVFKPYAGVKTAILVFTKGGKTENVWYYDVENDGLSLDDKREKINENDLPDVYKKWLAKENNYPGRRTEKSFFVKAEEIIEKNYNLSLSNYKQIEYEQIDYESPSTIINKLENLEQEIQNSLRELNEGYNEISRI